MRPTIMLQINLFLHVCACVQMSVILLCTYTQCTDISIGLPPPPPPPPPPNELSLLLSFSTVVKDMVENWLK